MTKLLKLLCAAAVVVSLGLSNAAFAGKDDKDCDEHGNPKVSAATIAARSKILGVDNVDQKTGQVTKDKVVFSWLTNSTFGVAMGGHVVLLDSFVTRLEVLPGRTPFVIQDLVDFKPEAILLGHGHFDHADNAAYIAQKTGAVIYATPETCDNMQLDAARNFGESATATSTVNCVSLTSRGSLPGAEIVPLRAFEPEVSVQVFKHLHSTNTAPQDTSFPPVVINSPVGGTCAPPCNLADPRDASLFPAGTPLATVLNIATSKAGAGGPIALFYAFKVKGPGNGFNFVWHNSSGALREGCGLPNNNPATGLPFEPGQDAKGCFGPATGAKLEQIMSTLGPVDLQLGSPVSLGFNINGERDIVDYITHLKPKVFIPIHVTAVAVESSSLEWRDGYFKQLNAMSIPASARPELMWLVDPNDYLRPLVFDPADPRFKK